MSKNKQKLKQQAEELLENTREIYDKIHTVYCPCLGAAVSFNAQGFHHFKYHGGGEARTIENVIYKLKLFPLVIPVIKNATFISDYKKDIEPKNRNNKTPQKEVEYWAIMCEVGKNRNIKIKVILKRTGNGKILFWSVMKLKK